MLFRLIWNSVCYNLKFLISLIMCANKLSISINIARLNKDDSLCLDFNYYIVIDIANWCHLVYLFKSLSLSEQHNMLSNKVFH